MCVSTQSAQEVSATKLQTLSMVSAALSLKSRLSSVECYKGMQCAQCVNQPRAVAAWILGADAERAQVAQSFGLRFGSRRAI